MGNAAVPESWLLLLFLLWLLLDSHEEGLLNLPTNKYDFEGSNKGFPPRPYALSVSHVDCVCAVWLWSNHRGSPVSLRASYFLEVPQVTHLLSG